MAEPQTEPKKTPPPVVTQDQDKIDAAGRLLHALAQDPKFRPEVLSLIKKASPDTPIPELDLIESWKKDLAENLKSNEEKTKPVLEKLEKIERYIARDEFKGKHDLSEADCTEVEELAKKGGISNSDTAIDYWKMKSSLGKPRGTAIPDDAAKKYQDNLVKINPRNTRQLGKLAVEEATRIMNDFSKRR